MTDNEHSGERRYEKAVALQYDDLEQLPRVTATGRGEVAKRIIALAEEHGVPVQRNDTLAELLHRVKTGREIPAESYTLVAEVVAFLYHVDCEWRKEHPFLEPVLGQEGSTPKELPGAGRPETSPANGSPSTAGR